MGAVGSVPEWAWAPAVAWALAALVAWRVVLRPGPESLLSPAAVRVLFATAVGLSVLLRLALAYATDGVYTDITCFRTWATVAAERGLPGFYGTEMFVDYPPGYVYVLWALGHLQRLLDLDVLSRAFLVLLKLPAILADVAGTALLYALARAEMPAPKAATLAALYAFSPVVLLNSSVWGQIDAILALLLVACLRLVGRRRYAAAAALLALAALTKPLALLLVPVGVAALVRERSGRLALRAAASAAALSAIVILPFALRQEPLWIVRLYAGTLGSYPYATLNAPNVWTLVAGNWAPISTRVLGVPAALWGWGALVVIALLAAVAALRARPVEDLWYGLALFTLSADYLLATKMHERYLFPAILLAAAAFATSGSPALFFLFAALGLSLFVGNAMVYDFVGRTGGFGLPPGEPALLGLAWLNLALFAVLLVVLCRRYLPARTP